MTEGPASPCYHQLGWLAWWTFITVTSNASQATNGISGCFLSQIQWSRDHCFDCTNSHLLKVSEWVLWQVPTPDRSMGPWGNTFKTHGGKQDTRQNMEEYSWIQSVITLRKRSSICSNARLRCRPLLTGASGIWFSSGMGSASCRNPNGAPWPKRYIMTRLCSRQAE